MNGANAASRTKAHAERTPRSAPAFANAVLLAPAVLSCLVLAAHYLRSFQPYLMALFLVLPALLLVPRGWTTRIVQAGLLFGAFEWVTTALLLLGQRQAAGEPYGRMLVILFGVAAGAVVSAVLVGSVHRRRQPAPSDPASAG